MALHSRPSDIGAPSEAAPSTSRRAAAKRGGRDIDAGEMSHNGGVMTNSTSDEAGKSSVDVAKAPPRIARAADLQAKVQLFAVVAVLVVAGLWLFSDVLLLVFAAALFSCQLRAAARSVKRRTRLPYGASLAIVLLAICAALFAVGYWRGPRLVSEPVVVYDQIQDQVARLRHEFAQDEWFRSLVDHAQTYFSASGNIAGRAAGFVSGTLGGLGSLLLILVAGIYFAASAEVYRDGFIELMPKTWRPRAKAVMFHEARALRRWFVGQLVDMTAIGLMTGAGLWLIGVPLVFTLALIAALANFVPYIGALAGSVPAIVVALGQSPQTALEVALLFVVVQSIEGNLISPLISRRTVDLPPVLTLFSQTVLGSLFGPMGLILATPITAAAMVLVKMVYVEVILDDAREA